jgi:hypothetical protein
VTRPEETQVTRCYKLSRLSTRRRPGASNTVLQALALALVVMASVGCGDGSASAVRQGPLPGPALPGWTAVDDPPGISQLAPDLSGLPVTGRADAKALVEQGDAIRATTFTFATAKDAAEAQKRGAGDEYQRQLERAFRGETVGHGPGVGLRLGVPRPTGTGSDVVEVYLLARGRRLTLVELVSARGFEAALRDRVLRLLSRRTAGG